jgi:hypothetical protein
MTTIVTRITNPTGGTAKGTPLSSAEIDQNFINLNDNKLEITDLVATNTANKGVKRDGSGGFSAGDISVGAISASSLTLSGTALTAGNGGTGATTYATGQILMGNSSGTLTKGYITGTSNQITVTNGPTSIALTLVQDIATSSNIQFGSIGINTSPSGTAGDLKAATATFSSNVRVASFGVGTAASGTTGEILATNQITAYYSDGRLKNVIGNIPNALEKVMSLNGVIYTGNSLAESFGYNTKEEQVGVIAAQVEAVLPQIVKPAPFDLTLFEGTQISKSGENYKTVQYEKLVPLLIEAIKELKQEVDSLRVNKG